MMPAVRPLALVDEAIKIGFDRLGGELIGGTAAWEAAGLPLGRIPIVRAAEASGVVVAVATGLDLESGR